MTQSRQRLIQSHIEILRRGNICIGRRAADQALSRPRNTEPVRTERLVENIRYTLQREQQAGESGIVICTIVEQTERDQGMQRRDGLYRRMACRDADFLARPLRLRVVNRLGTFDDERTL